MSIRDQVAAIFIPYKHATELVEALTKWRGLARSYENLEDRVAGKPPKRRKRRANPGRDTSSEEN